MWHEWHSYSAQFKNAVLTGVDAAGYPTSIRCLPVFNETRACLSVELVDGTTLEPGRASLLYHQHNDQLWDLKMFLVRGRLAREGQDWFFYPERIVPGNGLRHPLFDLLSILQMRRTAKTYLRRRALARPAIPWADLKALYP